MNTLLSLTEHDRQHRRAFMDYCTHSAEERFRLLLRIAYGHFERWNSDYFLEHLFPPHILILEPKSPTAEGDYSNYSGWGSKSQIRLRPSLFDGTLPVLVNGSRDPDGMQRYWLDVLIHELVHQYCHEALGKPERAEKGHGPIYTRECNRIGKLLGLPPVGQARKSRNKEGLPSCAFWPTCVRPADYYLGAYRPDLAPKRGRIAVGAPSAPGNIEGTEASDTGMSEPAPQPSNPLQLAEWRMLLAASHGLVIAALIERLAQHHGVPVLYPATPVASAEVLTSVQLPSATGTETDTVVMPSQHAHNGDARDVEILARLPTGFIPSHYQLNLFRFVRYGQGDGLVNAVAGSGKTTSLTLAARLIGGDGLFLAFNKHIAEELGERLKGTRMVARTIHGIGHATLMRHIGKVQIDDRKYRTLAQATVRASQVALGEPQRKAANALWELINLTRLTLTDPQNLPAVEALISHFGIELDPAARADVLALLPKVLAEGERIAERQKIIDYTDQLYLCYRWELQPKRFAWIFVDECQDLNAAQLDLVLKSRAEHGRIVFVGDPHQAIMGFAGADADSFWNIQQRTQATLLPLSVCYRCPTAHLDLARRIVPAIEAAPSALVGEIVSIEEEQIGEHIQPGDMIICRLTAPLIKTCIRLIEHRRSARVRGRDIGDQLHAIVRATTELPMYQWSAFGRCLDIYESHQVEKLAQREGSERQVESLRDRVEAVRVCHQSFAVGSADQLMREIAGLFGDNQPDITLSTVHRAKGLEGKRIFLLYPDKLPLVWERQQDWEYIQEMNLRYVALTRATQTLIFIRERSAKRQRDQGDAVR